MDAGPDILALTSCGGNQIEQQVNYRIRLSREKATLIPVNIPRRGFVGINIVEDNYDIQFCNYNYTNQIKKLIYKNLNTCLLYTSDAADDTT